MEQRALVRNSTDIEQELLYVATKNKLCFPCGFGVKFTDLRSAAGVYWQEKISTFGLS